MKLKFFIIIIIFILISCNKSINYIENINIKDTLFDPTTSSLKFNIKDTIYKTKIDTVYNRYYLDNIQYDIAPYNENKKVTIDSLIIIDNRDTSNLINKDFGIIAYNVPMKLIVNEYSSIKLRINRNNNIESVVIGWRKIPIVGTNSNDEIILENIEIDTKMKASLYVDKEIFEINLVNDNNEQSLLDYGYTEWVWRVKPLKPGKHYIKMMINISDRDIVVYEKNIAVENNTRFQILSWLEKWWEKIMISLIIPIIIPFIAWVYKKKRY